MTAFTSCLLLAATTLLAAAPALADEPSLVVAQADRQRHFSIAAQPLASALTAFGDQAGVQVTVDSTILSGLRSQPLTGTMMPEEALRRLLSGTGIVWRFTDPGTIALSRASSDATILDTVVVEGAGYRQNAWESPPGFVATHSATGTKTDTPLIETPQSISVVTRDQMDAQGAQGLQQALRYTAGISPVTRANFSGYDVMFGRGFALDRYLDGMKLQGNSGYVTPQIDLFGVERVEYIHGPASILYGQAGPGGIVNMVSKRPTSDPLHEITLQAGTHDTYGGGFDFAGPLDQDGEFLYRLTGLYYSADDQVDFVGHERYLVAPALTWRPDADTTLTLLAQYQEDPEVGLYNFVPLGASLSPNPNGKLPTSFYAGDPAYDTIDRTQYSAGYLLEHRFDEVWTGRQNFRFIHADGTLDQVLPLTLLGDGRTLMRYVVHDVETVEAITVDNQFQADFATGPVAHKFLVGLDYQRTLWDQVQGLALTAPLDLFDPVYDQDIAAPATTTSQHQTQNQLGLYAQDQLRWDRWVFVLGGRQDWTDQTTDNRMTASSTGQSDQKFTWRAGLVYLSDTGLAPYASYATSFQPVSAVDFGSNAYQPTEGEQYEIGLKYQPPQAESFVSVAAYHLTQQNVLTRPTLGGPFEQIGEVTTQGIEVEGHADLGEGFALAAAYTYLDGKVTRSEGVNFGKAPLYTPRHAASLWGDYTVQDGPAAGLGGGLGVRFVGATFGNDANTIRVPSNTLVDAAVRYDLGELGTPFQGWDLAVNASNLLDKTYVSECTNSNCLYGLRRSVIATLKYRW